MHLEQITAACFDWLISPQKVAVQVYAMSTLWCIGQQGQLDTSRTKIDLGTGISARKRCLQGQGKAHLVKIGQQR